MLQRKEEERGRDEERKDSLLSFLPLFSFEERGEKKKNVSLPSLSSPVEKKKERGLFLLLFPLKVAYRWKEETWRRGDHPARETTGTLSSRQMQNYVRLHANLKLAY